MRCQFICDDHRALRFLRVPASPSIFNRQIIRIDSRFTHWMVSCVSSLLRLSGSCREGWLSSSCTKLDHRCSEIWLPRWVIRGISSSRLTSSEAQCWNMDYSCSSLCLKVPTRSPTTLSSYLCLPHKNLE